MTAGASQSRVLTLVFTDLVDSTALKTARGDVVVGELIGRHREEVTRLASKCAGRIIDWAGDGCFLTFETPSSAVQFSLSLQRAHHEQSELPRVRVGLYMGEVTEKAGPDSTTRVEGLAVDLAARISGLAQPSQILMSSAVFNSARQRIRGDEFDSPVAWRAHGAYELKGFDDSLEMCEAGFEGVSPLEAPKGSEKAHRAVSPAEEDTLGWRPAVGLTVPRREHWVLEEPLGEGGFGEVWLASHDKTRAKRVFKFCFEGDRVKGLKREVVLFRLLRESLGHRDDIAQIMEWEFDRAPYFIESEYTQGGDLKDWAAGQGGIDRVPLATRLELIAQTAVALGAAHSVGVLHKDIKPANILISEAKQKGLPRAVLTDFGIGLLTDPQALLARGITAVGLTETISGGSSTSGSGTRLYMAPEVIEGKTSTTRSDIYALGVVLYQVAVGDLSRAIAPGWERAIEDDLLRDDIAACVDGNPELRLPSAEELATRLRSLETRRADREAARKAQAEAIRSQELLARARRRRRQFIVVTAVGLTVTATIAVVAFRENRRAETQSALSAELKQVNLDLADQKAEVEGALSAAKEARERAEYGQYVSTINLAAAQLKSGNTLSARNALLKTIPEYRDWEWGHLVDKAWLDQSAAGALPKPREATTALTWANSTPRVVHELPSAAGAVLRGTYSPDGKRIVTANFTGTARIWDAATGQMLTEIGKQGGFPVYNALLFPKHRRLLTATNESRLWDIVTGAEVVRLSSGVGPISVIARNDDESLAAVANADRTVSVFEVASGTLFKTFSGSDGVVSSIVFSPSGKEIAVASKEGTVYFWDLASGELLRTLHAAAKGPTFPSPDLKLAATVVGDTLTIWDMESAAIRTTVQSANMDEAQTVVEFSPDGSVAMYPTARRSSILIRTDTGSSIAELPAPGGATGGPVFRPDGGEIVVAYLDGAARVWRPFPAGTLNNHDVFGGHSDLVYRVAISPDGRQVASASYDGTVGVFELATGKPLQTLRGSGEKLLAVAYSGDGRRIAARGIDGETRVWDAQSGAQIAVIKSAPGAVFDRIAQGGGPYSGPTMSTSRMRALDVSAQGDRFSTNDESGLGVFDFTTGKKLTAPELTGTMLRSAFSPDGALIAVSVYEDNDIHLMNAETGKAMEAMKGHSSPLTSIEFSPDGARILTASLDGSARVWDVKSSRELFSITGHKAFLFSARYDGTGRKIVTASGDNTCKLWDAETGAELATLSGHAVIVKHAVFSPDGRRVMSFSRDGTIKVWDLEGNELSSLTGKDDVIDAAWSPSGDSIVSAWRDGNVRVFSAVPWAELAAIGDAETPFEERLNQWRRRASR